MNIVLFNTMSVNLKQWTQHYSPNRRQNVRPVLEEHLEAFDRSKLEGLFRRKTRFHQKHGEYKQSAVQARTSPHAVVETEWSMEPFVQHDRVEQATNG